MTTTKLFQGLNEDSKPSSRVMRPPGGGSSNIFGNEEPQQRAGQKKGPTHSNIFGDTEPDRQDEKVGKRRGGPPDNSRDNVFGGSTVEDKTRNDYKRRGQGLVNPITGAVTFKEDEREKVQSGDGDGGATYHSSSRVLAPPGGKSSGPLW